jgi:hypothetical protein
VVYAFLHRERERERKGGKILFSLFLAIPKRKKQEKRGMK